MDARLRAKLDRMIASLAQEHQEELAEQGTLATLEELTSEIGDMVARELTGHEVRRRASLLDEDEADCPDCGTCSPRAEPEEVILNGLRGEVAYRQPRYYCPKCRRAFFPSGGSARDRAPGDGNARHVSEDGLRGQ